VVRVANTNAGHDFPTGDPERHADIRIVARDAAGAPLAEVTQRIASRYRWWPDIEKLWDNRIRAGAYLDVPLTVPAVDGAFTVEIEAHKYRMYPEAFEHHDLEGEYVRGRRFHRSEWRVDADGRPSLVTITDDHGTREALASPEK
jgi:hypothetical protein